MNNLILWNNSFFWFLKYLKFHVTIFCTNITPLSFLQQVSKFIFKCIFTCFLNIETVIVKFNSKAMKKTKIIFCI